MSNSLLTNDIICNEALMMLENEMVTSQLVHRGYEEEFEKNVNGYKRGDTISIAKPLKYVVREGEIMVAQQSQEGKVSITLDKFRGVDLGFTETDRSLKIDRFAERFLKPAVSVLANHVDLAVAALYKDVFNWAGTPGQTVNSYADFLKGPTLLDDRAVPMQDRRGILTPTDHAGLLSTFSGLFINDVAKTALEKAKLPMLGDVELYKTQNVRKHTVGVATGTPRVNGANQVSTWDSVKNTDQQTLNTDGWTNSTTGILKQGDVFTIANVYCVNPVSKEVLPDLQQFVVKADADSGASTGPSALTISPAIIITGAYQNVNAAPADDALITVVGTGGAIYPQNMIFRKEAFALCVKPLEKPAGAVNPEVMTDDKTGLSLRLIPVYDGINNVSNWRLDILFGVKAIYPELATRLSGTS